MIALIKFEFQRKKGLFFIALAIMMIIQIFTTVRFFTTDKFFRVEYFEGIVVLYLIITLLVFIVLYLVDIVSLFRNDIYKTQGYMLFLSPNSGYKILASKLIFATLEGVVTTVIYLLILVLNARMLYGANFFSDLIQIEADWNIISLVLKMGISLVVSLVAFAVTIYLSFAIYKSLFPNFRFKGLLTFGIFIAITFLKERFIAYISAFQITQTYDQYIGEGTLRQTLEAITEGVSVNLFFNIVVVAISFVITGYLLEKKINL